MWGFFHAFNCSVEVEKFAGGTGGSEAQARLSALEATWEAAKPHPN